MNYKTVFIFRTHQTNNPSLKIKEEVLQKRHYIAVMTVDLPMNHRHSQKSIIQTRKPEFQSGEYNVPHHP